MKEIADISDGARMGVSPMTRKNRRPGMHERVSAYANVNAIGIVITVTTSATHNVFQIDCRRRGVAKYSWNCRNPTKAPSLSCTLFTRIMKGGPSRNSARAAQQARSRPCARRSCQWVSWPTRWTGGSGRLAAGLVIYQLYGNAGSWGVNCRPRGGGDPVTFSTQDTGFPPSRE